MAHTTDLPTLAPPEITRGESLEWLKSFDDFPADEWTVTYYFRGAGAGFNAIGTADGLDHVFTVPSTTTDDTTDGVYYFQAFAVKGSEKHLVDRGQTTVLPNLADIEVGTSYDGRSENKILLDAIDAVLAGKATLDQQSYTIGTAGSTRTLDRIPIPDLLELRKLFAAKVARENRRGKTNRLVFAQFDPVS